MLHQLVSQPWNFIVIKDESIRKQVKDSFLIEHRKTISILEQYDDKQRKEKYLSLKLETKLESALNICVTYDHSRFGPFVLGRTSIEVTGVYSVLCNPEPLACCKSRGRSTQDSEYT